MDTLGFTIRVLTLRDIERPGVMDDLNRLDLALSDSGGQITASHMSRVIYSGFSTTYVAVETGTGRLIGMATAVESPQPHSGKWWLEDVAVLDEFRGRKIGLALTIAVILHAKIRGAKKLDLTSTDAVRNIAQQLYRKLGWKGRKSWLARLDPQAFDPAAVLTEDLLALVEAI